MPDPGRITTKMQLRAEFSKEVRQLLCRRHGGDRET
jgi:hypothetical protein